MPEQNNRRSKYFEQSVNIRFRYLDKIINRMEKSNEKAINELKEEVKKIDQKVNESIEDNKTLRADIRADNKSTRYWVLGTGITVLLGLAAILLTFIQIQNSWMQQVFSFVGKAILK